MRVGIDIFRRLRIDLRAFILRELFYPIPGFTITLRFRRIINGQYRSFVPGGRCRSTIMKLYVVVIRVGIEY